MRVPAASMFLGEILRANSIIASPVAFTVTALSEILRTPQKLHRECSPASRSRSTEGVHLVEVRGMRQLLASSRSRIIARWPRMPGSNTSDVPNNWPSDTPSRPRFSRFMSMWLASSKESARDSRAGLWALPLCYLHDRNFPNFWPALRTFFLWLKKTRQLNSPKSLKRCATLRPVHGLTC
jgi:hypothetical protein